MENKKYFISNFELNGLLFMYYGILKGLETTKGLVYHRCFQSKKNVLDFAKQAEKFNINDLIEVVNNEYKVDE